MHNGAMLKYWGPLPPLSEFLGEQINGMLQNVNTNHHIHKNIIFFNQAGS